VGLITKYYFQRWEERRQGANVREQGIRKKREYIIELLQENYIIHTPISITSRLQVINFPTNCIMKLLESIICMKIKKILNLLPIYNHTDH